MHHYVKLVCSADEGLALTGLLTQERTTDEICGPGTDEPVVSATRGLAHRQAPLCPSFTPQGCFEGHEHELVGSADMRHRC
jgi:hypothetical protein